MMKQIQGCSNMYPINKLKMRLVRVVYAPQGKRYKKSIFSFPVQTSL